MLLIGYYFCLPELLFDDPYATILNDREGQLLSARIAQDGQWRFPEIDGVPEKYKKALLNFEDQYFYQHPGVNPLSIGRAIKQNVKAGRVVSGGSTLSMQLIRLHRKGKGRTVFEKLIEMVLATRLELKYSKSEVLALYASHAPFGGNTVGLSAATWRYFSRPPDELSWAEAALLAVLPNQPSLLYPGRKNIQLLEKRNRLLLKLYQNGEIDGSDLELALEEPLPDKPSPLPQIADHYLQFQRKGGKDGQVINTNIDAKLHRNVRDIIERHQSLYALDGIHNAAAIVLDVETGTPLAYVGNSQSGKEHGESVDIVQAPRSTGSLLKPILYSALLNEGSILPNTLIEDVPTFYKGFAPQNFNRQFDGVVHAKDAIARSLNIPAVNMLQQFGYPKFHGLLRELGLSTLNQPADHYGLSLILGGAEGSLWDMSQVYRDMALHLKKGIPEYPLDKASVWFAFEAMQEVYRPNEDASWEMYSSNQPIAWKTGTSFGFRDGWAIGVTGDYVVGVWVGNADGEGRPNLTGIQTAAPIMLEIFDLLPNQNWFRAPRQEMILAAVDRQSGYLASPYSNEVDSLLIPKKGLRTSPSPFHKRVHIDQSGQYLVDGACYDMNAMRAENRFVLPAKLAYYFKKKNPTYQEIPPSLPGCDHHLVVQNSMDMIYPNQNASLYVPVEQDGERGRLVFEAIHRENNAKIHWHLDNEYLGVTYNDHVMEINPSTGQHKLVIVDANGNELIRTFSVISQD